MENRIGILNDKSGNPYDVNLIKAGDLMNIWVSCEGDDVAEASCYIHGRSLQLSNITVIPKQQRRFPAPFSFICRTRRLTRRGIGTALLRFVIQYAKPRFEMLWGEIIPSDFRERPWLPQWYRREGFLVEMTPSGSGRLTLLFHKV